MFTKTLLLLLLLPLLLGCSSEHAHTTRRLPDLPDTKALTEQLERAYQQNDTALLLQFFTEWEQYSTAYLEGQPDVGDTLRALHEIFATALLYTDSLQWPLPPDYVPDTLVAEQPAACLVVQTEVKYTIASPPDRSPPGLKQLKNFYPAVHSKGRKILLLMPEYATAIRTFIAGKIDRASPVDEELLQESLKRREWLAPHIVVEMSPFTSIEDRAIEQWFTYVDEIVLDTTLTKAWVECWRGHPGVGLQLVREENQWRVNSNDLGFRVRCY